MMPTRFEHLETNNMIERLSDNAKQNLFTHRRCGLPGSESAIKLVYQVLCSTYNTLFQIDATIIN